MKDILNRLDSILNEGQLGDMANRVEQDHEVQMARADLYKLAKYSIQLHDMLKNVSEEQGLEGWVQAKITKAADYIGSVKHHLEYQEAPEAQDDIIQDIAFDLATEDAGYSEKDRGEMDALVTSVNKVVDTPKPDDPGLERDRTTGNPADGIGARAAAQNAANMKKAGDVGKAAANQKLESKRKYSDWSKK
jgi:hypothetical protein